MRRRAPPALTIKNRSKPAYRLLRPFYVDKKESLPQALRRGTPHSSYPRFSGAGILSAAPTECESG